MNRVLISCTVATTELTSEARNNNNDAFTKDNLVQMCNTINRKGIHIYSNYMSEDIIGETIYAEVIGNKLKTIISIDEGVLSVYILPSYTINNAEYNSEKDTFTLIDVSIKTLSLSQSPQDLGVTKFKVLQW